jgi:alpha-D-xyloside xylohydrolase
MINLESAMRRPNQLSRRRFASLTACGALLEAPLSAQPAPPEIQEVHHGVWRIRLGSPEQLTPVSTRKYSVADEALRALPSAGACPISPDAIAGRASRGGYLVSLPLEPNELVYGLGLQLQSFIQRGLKKMLRVNADAKMDTGDSHAPVPFYVSTRGYGVLIDTARYATFYCGSKARKARKRPATANSPAPDSMAGLLPAAYRRYRFGEPSEVLAEVPRAAGVDIYIFGGPAMRLAVQRYNLFAGGGALPPRWGLGLWYRCGSTLNQDEVLGLAREFRERRIPCDVLGLEPGWQTQTYSCSFVWNKGRFADPAGMIGKLSNDHYWLNLWEHAYTHPNSPIYDALFPFAGDYEVWGGLVPDFLQPEARQIFADFHDREHVSLGVSGYKLDECDNSDLTGNWSFPEVSAFPSGADGEQMHSFLGLRYQDTIQSIFDRRKMRTYGLVRSSHALAAPYPFVLYSDLYDHKEYIRALVNSGFSGLLWTPEVRDARSTEDLIRRLQTVLFSPLAQVDTWYMKNPPWKQVERKANSAGQFTANWQEVEAQCRTLIELRMRLAPYLYAAFVRYREQGLPPFRALVLDYPDDSGTWTVDDQFLMGESLLIAPVTAEQSQRTVYLPEGGWFDFWTGNMYSGKKQYTLSVPLDQIPVFVKSGALLPLADPGLHAEDVAGWQLTVQVYGANTKPAVLYEDDGSPNPQMTSVTVNWDHGKRSGSLARSGPTHDKQYAVKKWQVFQG